MTFARIRYLVFFMALFLVFGCGTRGATQATMRDINIVKEAHVNDLMAFPGVVGVYVSALQDGTPCIKVMVIKTTAELEKQIPRSLEGHPVLIVETGEIKPLSAKPRSG